MEQTAGYGEALCHTPSAADSQVYFHGRTDVREQSSQIITLIHPPTVALRIQGFDGSRFPTLAGEAIYLGNVYRRIIPPSLPRVAAVLERETAAHVSICDLRTSDYKREEAYKVVEWEGYEVEARRVGGSFSGADAAICDSDWVGISSHFTFESGVVRDLIRHTKAVNPGVKVMVGGADVTARPHDYIRFGADMAFLGDFDPEAFQMYCGEPTIVPRHKHPFERLTLPAFEKLANLRDYDESHDGPVPAGVPFPIAFSYVTRGCPRTCDFCESRRTGFEVLDLCESIRMLEHYRAAGIQTLNFADDNLLFMTTREETRKSLLRLMEALRDMGFAWEYPNGLEIGRLIKGDALDEELLDALFSHTVDPLTGRIVGAYRVYVPVETFDNRERYRKLKPLEQQNRVIKWLSESGLPEVDFGIVLPPDADEGTFESVRLGYQEIRDIMERGGKSLARYAIFHLIPIALYREMETKYSVDEFPEGWNFYFPVYDGKHFSARELFERRLELVHDIDPWNLECMKQGRYGYS